MVVDTSFWNEASGTKKGLLVAGVLIIAGLAIVGSTWVLNEPYAVLFSDLEETDAGRVIDELEQMNRAYTLGDAGRSILVPASEVHDTRIRLMSSGVPLAGGVGFEIFDDVGFGMTEFAQRINYQRALEGELTRTIMALEEVRYARVHVVMPEGSLFESERDSPSAAVTVFLDDGARPSVRQIRGIQNLVAASVPRLQSSQVTVSDENGRTLSATDPDDGVGNVSSQLERKIEVERYLSQKVNDILVQAFGPGQAMVSVDAMLDFSEATITTESILPNGASTEAGVVRRRETRSDGERIGSSGGSNTTTEIEYELGRSVEQMIERPGRILRLGVGVVVPADTSEERRHAIADLAAVTVGLDPSRGDSIAVYSLASQGGARVAIEETTVAGNASADRVGATADRARPSAGNSNLLTRVQAVLGSMYAMIALLVLVVAALFVVLLRSTRGKHGNGAASLPRPEREELLRQVQTWLKEGSTGGSGGAGP